MSDNKSIHMSIDGGGQPSSVNSRGKIADERGNVMIVSRFSIYADSQGLVTVEVERVTLDEDGKTIPVQCGDEIRSATFTEHYLVTSLEVAGLRRADSSGNPD